MRLRKIKGADIKVNNSNYVIKNYKDNIGNWNKVFNNSNPIKIEIGMGKGNFIINNAIKYPNINFIGIEKYDSVLVKAIEKLETLDLPNLKIIMMDAKEINEVFNKEIDTIYLNFSDPWPKKRHTLRRLTSPIFLDLYDNIFKGDKVIVQKTDNRKLFEYSLMSLVEHNYKIEKISLDLYNDDTEDNIPTEYEEKFSKKGQNIYMVEAKNVNLHVKNKKTMGK